jgi:hypothetical protein
VLCDELKQEFLSRLKIKFLNGKAEYNELFEQKKFDECDELERESKVFFKRHKLPAMLNDEIRKKIIDLYLEHEKIKGISKQVGLNYYQTRLAVKKEI